MTLVYFVTLFYATIPQTHEHCADDKKIIVNADPGIFFGKEWKYITSFKE